MTTSLHNLLGGGYNTTAGAVVMKAIFLFSCFALIVGQKECRHQVQGLEYDNNDQHEIKNEIGIALAGGNFRAGITGMGVLRGFYQKKVTCPNSGKDVPAMDLVKYNSGISGGSIPAILYTYAQVPTEELLDLNRLTTNDPSKITPEMLSSMPGGSMGSVFARKRTQPLNMAKALLRAAINPFNMFKYHSLWTSVMYRRLLEPLKIPRNKYFTSSEEELERILDENPQLKKEQFLIPRDDVKTMPMILFSMYGTRFDMYGYADKYMETRHSSFKDFKDQESASSHQSGNKPNMTDIILSNTHKNGRNGNLPMPYVATPDIVENMFSGSVQVRGREIVFPEKIVKPFEWGLETDWIGREKRFSTEFLTGLSTNFLGMQTQFYSKLLTAVRKIKASDNSTITQKFADGGLNDLMGILPLVQKGVRNIISVFNYNQHRPTMKLTDSYADIYKHANATSIDDVDFDIHFQEWLLRINPNFTCAFGYFGNEEVIDATIMNHVFYDPKIDRLKELMIKFNSLFKAGEPLIATLKDLEVIDNPFWNIQGARNRNQKVDLTLMYFNLPRKFSEDVPIDAVPPPKGMDKLDADGRFNNENLRSVPELSVDGADMLFHSNEQANMLVYLSSWMVNHSWDGLKGHNGEIMFEGFKEIFEKNK